MNSDFRRFVPLAILIALLSLTPARAQILPAHLAPIPDLPATRPVSSVPMGDPRDFPEIKMDFPIADGPIAPTWESINQHYQGEPAWLRDAKFGFWVHFGPQSAGQSGDWYARRIYQPGQSAYNNHLRDFGPPSQTGYMDVLKSWNPKQLDPAKLVQLYHDAGARFLLVQGVHHDNYDNWNSRYQPWNSVNVGPHRDILGEWNKAAKSAGMRIGVSFHHEYTWWWYQPAFAADKTGPRAGAPYDAARLTLADGKGTWWEGYDPRLLYTVNLRQYQNIDTSMWAPKQGIFSDHPEYARWYMTQWALRILDVIDQYDPDFYYTDGDSTQPFSGISSGTGAKSDAAPRVVASFFNRALQKHGKLDVFNITKFHPPCNGIVNTQEGTYPRGGIKTDQPWIGENAVGDWFYAPGFTYDAGSVVRYLLEYVSRDGNYMVNIPIRPDGSLDDKCVTMLQEIGAWMKINGEGIYGSHAWKRFGESAPDPGGMRRASSAPAPGLDTSRAATRPAPASGAPPAVRVLPPGHVDRNKANFPFAPTDFRFTVGKDGSIYAFCLTVPPPNAQLRITSLGTSAQLLDPTHPIKSVTLLGSDAKLDWRQTPDALEISCPPDMPYKIAVTFKIGIEAN